ncbi:MAG: ABC transporter ATP-binding protein [Bacteroidales bacterium]|nr:ABC transporter ATP-binding protein [Bacteroidales bacterium]
MGYFDETTVSPVTPTPAANPLNVIDYINITQKFENGRVLFDNFNLSIADIKDGGQFTTILGRSGCGKTQLLKYLSDLQSPTSGDILIYGKKHSIENRIPMVFQEYSSFPWFTVLQNVSLPLVLKGVSKPEAEAKAMKMIDFVGLKGHEYKWAKQGQLSGGQLQRVAIARNLVSNPQILLLDEPLSALDIITKNDVQNLLLELFYNKETDITFIYVTHDIREAVYLSNRIIILGGSPTQIVKDYSIDLGHRTPDIKHTLDFVNHVKQIDEDFSKVI